MEGISDDVRAELLTLVDKAIDMSNERITRLPTYAALKQIRAQLLEVRADVARGGAPDQALKERVIFGRFAVRELEDVDPEYANVLTRAAYLYREKLGSPIYPGL